MRRRNPQTGSGQQLLADFQTAFASSATIEAVKDEAARSENALLNHLAAVSNGSYLHPDSLSSDVQADITRSSLDTHIKKVQARQLDSINAQQLQQLLTEDRTTYTGRKIVVTNANPANNAIESVWFDQRTGFRSNPIKRRKVVGIVQDVLLERNLLILQPTLRARLMSSNLENYMIYVIDPATLLPMVDLALL